MGKAIIIDRELGEQFIDHVIRPSFVPYYCVLHTRKPQTRAKLANNKPQPTWMKSHKTNNILAKYHDKLNVTC